MFFYTPPPTPPTTIERDPCPHCGCRDYFCKDQKFVCKDCKMTAEMAASVGPKKRVRDENGSLVCQRCGTPNEYAEAPPGADYYCTGCRFVRGE